jgi:hypothetical protein
MSGNPAGGGAGGPADAGTLSLALQLKKTIEKLMSMPGAVRPEKARFFRSQMQTIITKALTDVGIKAVPSRRCFTVMGEPQAKPFLPRDLTIMHRSSLGCMTRTDRCMQAAHARPCFLVHAAIIMVVDHLLD